MARSKKDTSVPPTTSQNGDDQIITLSGMYQNYFLDYASYVILERAVPALEDGLKPVQRRILHAMFAQHDGRYHKVANLIGQTMQFHPHCDAAIGEARIRLARTEGVFVEPASSTALACVIKDREAGRLSADDRVVLVLTGSGLKELKSIEDSVPAPTRIAPDAIVAQVQELFG